jgi:hypothetical protein
MNNYLRTLLFVTYGIAMIALASVLSKEMNQENVSDRFVSSQQAILSLGSMSLAFGLLLGVLVNRNMLQTQGDNCVRLSNISLVLGALLTVSLLLAVSLMFKETRSDELKDSKLHKVVLSGFGLVVLSLLIHGVAFFMIRRGKNNSSSSSSPF